MKYIIWYKTGVDPQRGDQWVKDRFMVPEEWDTAEHMMLTLREWFPFHVMTLLEATAVPIRSLSERYLRISS